MARPQGRPLAEHVWRDGGWYLAVTGEPFDEEVYIAGVRRRQAECERRRYWDDASGARKRRLLRSMREAANNPRKRRAGVQLTLESAQRSAADLPRLPKVVSHPEQALDALGAYGGSTSTTCSGNGCQVPLHGHAQDPVAQLER